MKKLFLSMGAILALNLTLQAQGPVERWAQGMPGNDAGAGWSIVHDPSGNSYTVGIFTGTVDLDPGPLVQNHVSNGDYDFFVLKLDPNGNYLWSHSFGDTLTDHAVKVVYDKNSDNIYIAGDFKGTIDFDPGAGSALLTSAGNIDGFVLRLTSAGNYVSVYRMGGVLSTTYASAIAVDDATGDLYTAGTFNGIADLDPTLGTTTLTSTGSPDIYIHKMSPAGVLLWVERLVEQGSGKAPSDMIADASGVYVTGFFMGTADFDPSAGTSFLTPTGNADIFVTKLNTSGVLQWADAMGGAGSDYGHSITVDVVGNVYYCGEFEGSADFDPGVGTTTINAPTITDFNGYVSKLNAAGTFGWARSLYGTNSRYSGIGMDNTDLYLTGNFSGTIDFDPSAMNVVNLTSTGGVNMFLQKLTTAGTYLWAKNYGGPAYGIDISVMFANTVYVCGEYLSTFPWTAAPYCSTSTFSNLPAPGNGEILVAKWEREAVPRWHQTTKNAASRDNTKDVITDNAGDVYVTGFYSKQTTLAGGLSLDQTLNSGSGILSPTSYIAKYNACGDLIWEAHAITHVNNYGNSIVLDQINNRVYITGDFQDKLLFTTANTCTSGPASVLITSSGFRGYIAAFDMTTGCLEVLEPINVSAYTRCEAITTNETNGAIYVGGAYSTTVAGTIQSSFISKYTPNPLGTTLGPVIASVTSNSVTGGNNKIMDMDFNESGTKLWAIGNYIKNVTFTPGGLITSLNPSVSVDAFLVSYNDIGSSFTPSVLQRGNNAIAMTGEGVTVDASDNSIYVTGSYRDAMPSAQPAFQVPGLLLSATGSSMDKAYLIKYSGASTWAKSGISSSSVAVGKSVSARLGVAYFTGNYVKNALQLTGYPALAFYTVGSAGSFSHAYFAAYNANGTIAYPTANVTGDATNTSVHEVESIYAGVNGHHFMVGMYSGKLVIDNLLVSPLNDLTSTGSAGHTNGFLIRVNANFAGAFRSQEMETEPEVSALAMDLSLAALTVYPNPTNGQLTVSIAEFDPENKNYTITVYNALGKQVKQVSVTGANTNIDLSNNENGIYLVAFSNGSSTEVVRVSKTN